MFNLGAGEIAIILIAALLILGPKQLPELARGLGKFLKDFRKQTDDVRSVVEREFYKMEDELHAPPPSPSQSAQIAAHSEHPPGSPYGVEDAADEATPSPSLPTAPAEAASTPEEPAGEVGKPVAKESVKPDEATAQAEPLPPAAAKPV
jgi:sec-independent protein translocase protein TatB